MKKISRLLLLVLGGMGLQVQATLVVLNLSTGTHSRGGAAYSGSFVSAPSFTYTYDVGAWSIGDVQSIELQAISLNGGDLGSGGGNGLVVKTEQASWLDVGETLNFAVTLKNSAGEDITSSYTIDLTSAEIRSGVGGALTFKNRQVNSAVTVTSTADSSVNIAEVFPVATLGHDHVFSVLRNDVSVAFQLNDIELNIAAGTDAGSSSEMDLTVDATVWSSESDPATNSPIDNATDGYVRFIKPDSWVVYKRLNFHRGTSFFEALCSSANNGGTIELRLDGTTGTKIGEVEISDTSSWDSYETFSTMITSDVSGVHDLYLCFVNAAASPLANLLNIKTFRFSSAKDDMSVGAVLFDDESHPGDNSQIRIYTNSDGKMLLGNIKNETWIQYDDFKFGDGMYSCTVSASSTNGGTIEYHLDDPAGFLVGEVTIPSTINPLAVRAFRTYDLAAVTGTHPLYVCFKGEGGNLFDLEKFKFNSIENRSNTIGLGKMNGFYRNRRIMDRDLGTSGSLLKVPEWICDPNLDFHYELKDNATVLADSNEVFLADNLILVRLLGGWNLSGTDDTIEKAKLHDLFYLDNDQAAYRWNLLTERISPYIDRGYACSNITLVLDNVPYDMAENITLETYGQAGIPRDFAEWGEFIRQLCIQLLDTYGDDAKSFRFRIGTEMSHTFRWPGTESQYLEFYDAAASAITNILPGAKVGAFNRGAFDLDYLYNVDVLNVARYCSSNGLPFDFIGQSAYYNKFRLHPDDFMSDLRAFYQQLQLVDRTYQTIPREFQEYDPISTELGYMFSEAGVRAAAVAMETMVDGKKIGITDVCRWVDQEEISEKYGKILLYGNGWLSCILDHLRGGDAWRLPCRIVSGSTSNSIETLASVKDDVTYILVSCWNVDRKATGGSTVEVILPTEVKSMPGSVLIRQILFDETSSASDVIWNYAYTNDLLSADQLDQLERGGKAVTSIARIFADPSAFRSEVRDSTWPIYEQLIKDSLTLKPFTGSVEDREGVGMAMTLTLPAPAVYVVAIQAGSSDYDSWAAGFNLSGSPDADPGSDYDSDGWDNLREYGLGGNPTNGFIDGNIPTFEQTAGAAMNYIHAQRADDPGLFYCLELSDDLLLSNWTNSGYTVVATNGTGGTFDFVTNSIPTTDSRKFIRLIIEKN
jgi:hypothetical protein